MNTGCGISRVAYAWGHFARMRHTVTPYHGCVSRRGRVLLEIEEENVKVVWPLGEV